MKDQAIASHRTGLTSYDPIGDTETASVTVILYVPAGLTSYDPIGDTETVNVIGYGFQDLKSHQLRSDWGY